LAEERTARILQELIEEESANAYQLEKSSGLAHSTFWDIFQPLVRLGYVEIESRQQFRTGRETKNYRISSAGFFALMRSLAHEIGEENSVDTTKPFPQFYPKNKLWNRVESILLERPYLCPWLSQEIGLMVKLGAKDFARCYTFTCITRQGGVVTIEGLPPPRAASPYVEERQFWNTLAPLLLEILYPQMDIGSFGVWHSHFPGRILSQKPNPTALRLLQEQVRRYLATKKDLSKYIQLDIRRASSQLDELRSAITRIQAEFVA
jgi:hypothetical protein